MAMDKLITRPRHLRQLIHRGVWMILLLLWGFFGLLATVRDNFLSVEARASWDTLRVIPHWSAVIWMMVFLLITMIGLFEGSYRIRQEAERILAQYRAGDPRIEITKVVAHGFVPYQIAVHASVENPGEPTVLRSWALSVTNSAGEMINGRLLYTDNWLCRSYEPTKSGSVQAVDNATTPIRSGGTAEAVLNFCFAEPLFTLGLDEETRFTVSCRTIKNVRVEGTRQCVPSRPAYQWPLDDRRTMDQHLRLPDEPTRTNLDRLLVARALFDELVDAAARGSQEARTHVFHIGRYVAMLSLDCHGMTTEYVRDFDRFRDGCVRAGIRSEGYSGDS